MLQTESCRFVWLLFSNCNLFIHPGINKYKKLTKWTLLLLSFTTRAGSAQQLVSITIPQRHFCRFEVASLDAIDFVYSRIEIAVCIVIKKVILEHYQAKTILWMVRFLLLFLFFNSNVPACTFFNVLNKDRLFKLLAKFMNHYKGGYKVNNAHCIVFNCSLNRRIVPHGKKEIKLIHITSTLKYSQADLYGD